MTKATQSRLPQAQKPRKDGSGSSGVFAPGTTITYAPELIPKFIQDHQMLVATFGQIVAACTLRDSTKVKSKLGEFSSAVNEHLVTENIRLYVYLQRNLRNDIRAKESIGKFRSEMAVIAKSLMAFVDKYRAQTNWAPAVFEALDVELAQIAEVLTQRIQAEERDLYTLYRPVQDYLQVGGTVDSNNQSQSAWWLQTA